MNERAVCWKQNNLHDYFHSLLLSVLSRCCCCSIPFGFTASFHVRFYFLWWLNLTCVDLLLLVFSHIWCRSRHRLCYRKLWKHLQNNLMNSLIPTIHFAIKLSPSCLFLTPYPRIMYTHVYVCIHYTYMCANIYL